MTLVYTGPVKYKQSFINYAAEAFGNINVIEDFTTTNRLSEEVATTVIRSSREEVDYARGMKEWFRGKSVVIVSHGSGTIGFFTRDAGDRQSRR
jgi:hypothetical protein